MKSTQLLQELMNKFETSLNYHSFYFRCRVQKISVREEKFRDGELENFLCSKDKCLNEKRKKKVL